ncbi:MAG: tetratricopeptide repeat protein [Ignavibacteriaceae bacterium]
MKINNMDYKMKAITFVTLLVVITSITFAQQKYDEASKYIQNKEYSKALAIAQDYLNHDSTDIAIKILVDLSANNPNNPRVYEALGDAYYKMGVLELSLSDYQKAESLDSLNLPLKFKTAKALIKQKSYTDAANKYLQVISLDSTYAPAYYELGSLLYYAKQYPNAAYYLEKYLSFSKKYDAFFYAARSFYLMQNFPKAIEVSQKGLQVFPNDLKLERIEALALADNKNFAEALKLLQTLPDSLFSATEYSTIGGELKDAKQDSVAIIYMVKALTKDSTLTELYQDIANMDLSSGKYNQAIVYYDKRIKSDSTSVSSYVNKALSYIQLQNYDSAKVALVQATNIKSDYMPALIWLARTYQYMKSNDDAADVYNKILKITSGNEDKNKTEVSEAYGFFGYTDLVKKKYKEAIESLKAALNYSPDNAQYHLWLAQAYAFSGNKAEAAKEYRAVLSIDPNNADAKRGLKLLSL